MITFILVITDFDDKVDTGGKLNPGDRSALGKSCDDNVYDIDNNITTTSKNTDKLVVMLK